MSRPSAISLLLVLTVALFAYCSPEEDTGTVQVPYRLESIQGYPLTCEEAGIATIHVAMLAHREDTAVKTFGTVPCEVDENGEGLAQMEIDTGFYESSLVSMRTAADEIASQYNGALAIWEYLSVEVSEGGLTDYVPACVGIFSGAPAVCGNGRVELGEECDDGNTTDGDGCSAECLDEVSGELTINWIPTQDASEVTCGVISAETVDITVYETGGATLVATAADLICTELSHTFTDIAFGSFDVVVRGLDGSSQEVADGSALGVSHETISTVVDVELIAP